MDDSASLEVGAQVLIPVLDNDSGAALALASVGVPVAGSALVEGNAIRYTAPSVASSQTFTYTIADRNGISAAAQVEVTVLAAATPTPTPVTPTPETPTPSPTAGTPAPNATPGPGDMAPRQYLPNVVGKP